MISLYWLAHDFESLTYLLSETFSNVSMKGNFSVAVVHSDRPNRGEVRYRTKQAKLHRHVGNSGLRKLLISSDTPQIQISVVMRKGEASLKVAPFLLRSIMNRFESQKKFGSICDSSHRQKIQNLGRGLQHLGLRSINYQGQIMRFIDTRAA